MYVLGIDTATMVCSIGLADQERIVAERILHTRKTHSERLMPMIQQMLADVQLAPQDLNGIAVSIGPGSFTGLRIGITTAKSLAFALHIPIVGISTLEALAAQFPYSRHLICPIIDAQKGNVYTALFRTDEGYPIRINEYQVISMDDVIKHSHSCGQSVIITGELSEFSEQLQTMADSSTVLPAPALYRMPRGAVIAALGLHRLLAGQGEDASVLAPFYIRRSEAEVLWEQRYCGGDSDGSEI
jgi:tRNA threonylcarbamoyladenosine biosynthesis protein TsaB